MRKILAVLLLVIIIPLFLFHNQGFCEDKAEYALIITIDGLRPDAILIADAPHLKNLIKEGSYSPTARTVDPPKTLPSHLSLITGLSPSKHGTYENKWTPDMGYTEFDTIFTIAKDEGFSTAMFVGKDKLNFLAVPESIDKLEVIDYTASSVKEITDSFIKYMRENKPQITLIHFPEPDMPGHKYGWMSVEYLESVHRVDIEIGKILDTLKKTGDYDKTLIVITSDHGGEGKSHSGKHPIVTNIPWLAVGNNIRKNYTIKTQVYIYDTAPTVLYALGIKPLKNIEGEIIKEIFTK